MKNIKLTSLLVSACILIGVFPSIVFADDWNGAAKTEPQKNDHGAYVITSAEELAWFSDNASFSGSSENAILASNIDLSGKEWTPIGKSNYAPYSGNFDGNGHTISGLKTTNAAYAGLFGYVTGTVSNLTVTGEITYIGYNTCYAGGIAGYNIGAIENCISETNISGKATGGGISGTNEGSVTGCINKGNISGSSGDIGGITGSAKGGSISLCANYGNAESTSYSYAGGIAGRIQGSAVIENVYSMGNIKGKYTGGIAGYVYSSSVCINNAYAAGKVTCTGSYAGGVAGQTGYNVSAAGITNCYFLKSDTINSDIYAVQKSGNDRDDLCGKTDTELKSAEFIVSLGGAFEADDTENPINNGYPILKWQTKPERIISIDGEILKKEDALINAGVHRIDADYSQVGANIEKGLLTLAVYTENDSLEKIWLSSEAHTLSAEYNFSAGTIIKLFFWNDDFLSVCAPVQINVQ